MNLQLKKGSSVIEIVLAVAIFAVFSAALILALTNSYSLGQQGSEQFQSENFSREGIEAVRSIIQQGWNLLENGNHGVTDTSGYWDFSGSSDTFGTNPEYTRVVNVSDVYRDVSGDIVTSGGTIDLHTKKVTSTTSWEVRPGITNEVELVAYVTNWESKAWNQTNWNGGSGQTIWSDTTRYNTATNIDNSTSGQISLESLGGGGSCDDNSWTFTTPGNYIYDSDEIDVTGGMAQLKTVGSCSGTEDACSTFVDQPSCILQVGCSWDLADCSGTETPCGSLGTGDCATCGCGYTAGSCSNNGSCGACGDNTACTACSCGGCSWSSCPFIYVWDGNEYQFVAESITPFALPEAENTALTVLPGLVPQNGEYKIQIKENLQETTFINDVFLLAVDHPLDTEVYPDMFGNLYTFKESINPSSCINEEGEDCLEMFLEKDSKYWNWLNEDYLKEKKSIAVDQEGNLTTTNEDDLYSWAELTFPKPENADSVKFVWSTREHDSVSWAWKFFKDLLGYNNPELIQEKIDNRELVNWFMNEVAIIKFEIWDGKYWRNEYNLVEASASTIPTVFAYKADIADIPGDQLKVRFKSIHGYRSIDSVDVDYSQDQTFVPYYNVIPTYPKQALLDNQDVKKAVTKIDDTRAVIDTGSVLDLSFPEKYKILGDGYKRSYILALTGYYFAKYDKVLQEPDLKTANRLLKEPQFTPRFFIPRYFEYSESKFNLAENQSSQCNPYFTDKDRGCILPLVKTEKIETIFPLKKQNIFDYISLGFKMIALILLVYLLYKIIKINHKIKNKLYIKIIFAILLILLVLICIGILNDINIAKAQTCDGTLTCTSCPEVDCISCSQCDWTAASCSGTADLCNSYDNSSDCSTCGCDWDTANCEGTATACSAIIDETSCNNQSSCSWASGYSTSLPTIEPNDSYQPAAVGQWTGFNETATKNGGEIYYQLSNDDGSSWYYWDGSQWATAGSSNYNTASVVDSNIWEFDASAGKIMFKAFLESDGTQLVQLDEISIDSSVMQVELGSVSTDENWQYVDLANIYTSPVVFTSYFEDNNTLPASVRIRNLDSNSFEVALQNPADSDLSSDTIYYLVAEEGIWTLDGQNFEVHKYDTSTVAYKNNWTGDSKTFTKTYSIRPVVLSQVQTFNNSDWITSWVAGTSNSSPPSTTAFQTSLNGAEAATSHGSETLGWLAMTAGVSGTFASTEYETQTTTDTIQGHGNGCYTFSYSNVYTSNPLTIVSQQEMDGGDGSWLVICSEALDQIGVHAEEDQETDSERNHTTESGAFIAWEGTFDFSDGFNSGYIIDDTQAEFDQGSYSNTQYSTDHLELTSTGITNGTGTFTSDIIDANQTVSWNTFAWVPNAPYGKELPTSEQAETAYAADNIDMSDNLVYYKLNESSGATSFTDSSGNGVSGSCSGDACPTMGGSGKLSTAADFDGTDDAITASSDLNQWLGDTASISVWIKTTQTGDDTFWDAPGITGYEEGGTGDDIFWGWIDASGYINIHAGNGTVATSTTSINDGEWHHIGMTRNSSTGLVQIYVDGSLEDSQTSETGVKTNSFYEIGMIKDSAADSDDYYDGMMDEFTIFDTVISGTVFQDIYLRGSLRIKYQVRSCNDSGCSGESFIGPDGSGSTYYSEINNTSLGLPSINLSSVGSNQFFQYQITFETDDNTNTPEVDSLTIGLSALCGGGGGYATSGTLESSAYDTGSQSSFNIIEWNESDYSNGDLKVQIKTAPDSSGSPGTWSTEWSGPDGEDDGDETDFYTTAAGEYISPDHNGDQWIKYLVTFTSDGSGTDTLEDITINYTP